MIDTARLLPKCGNYKFAPSGAVRLTSNCHDTSDRPDALSHNGQATSCGVPRVRFGTAPARVHR